MIKRLLREERGAVLPLVAICLAIFMLGFTALVIDAGFLYLERRALVTAADAGALAGAKELSDNLPDFSEELKDKATKIAKEVAVANGVDDADNVLVTIETRNVKYKNNLGQFVNENRKIIEVKVKNTKQLIFARFLGDTEADVAASAVATWGCLKATSGGSILPIFSMDTLYHEYETNPGALVYLNGDKFLEGGSAIPEGGIVPGNWGLFDIKKAALDPTGVTLTSALIGEASSKDMVLKATLESETGGKIGQVDNVIQRMEDAVSKYPGEGNDQIKARQQYMRGLVPIIDSTSFVRDNPVNANGRLPNPLKLTIAKFVVFEIRDYLSEDATGTEKALDTIKYLPTGIKQAYPGYSRNTIVGVYTGEEVPVRAEIVAGDQDLGAGEIKTLTYQKLIQ